MNSMFVAFSCPKQRQKSIQKTKCNITECTWKKEIQIKVIFHFNGLKHKAIRDGITTHYPAHDKKQLLQILIIILEEMVCVFTFLESSQMSLFKVVLQWAREGHKLFWLPNHKRQLMKQVNLITSQSFQRWTVALLCLVFVTAVYTSNKSS